MTTVAGDRATQIISELYHRAVELPDPLDLSELEALIESLPLSEVKLIVTYWLYSLIENEAALPLEGA